MNVTVSGAWTDILAAPSLLNGRWQNLLAVKGWFMKSKGTISNTVVTLSLVFFRVLVLFFPKK